MCFLGLSYWHEGLQVIWYWYPTYLLFSRCCFSREDLPSFSIKLTEPHASPLWFYLPLIFPTSNSTIANNVILCSHFSFHSITWFTNNIYFTNSSCWPTTFTSPFLFPSQRSHKHTQPPSSKTIIVISCLIPLLILIILCILYLKCYPLMLFSPLIDSLLLLYLFILNSNLQCNCIFSWMESSYAIWISHIGIQQNLDCCSLTTWKAFNWLSMAL